MNQKSKNAQLRAGKIKNDHTDTFADYFGFSSWRDSSDYENEIKKYQSKISPLDRAANGKKW